MHHAVRTAVCLAALTLAACERQPPAPSSSPAPAAPIPTAPTTPTATPDPAHLTAHLTDTTGALIARGHLRLPAAPADLPEGEFEGDWSFERAADEIAAPDPGIIGAGRFRGYRDADNILLDLNPGTADANHLLTFTLDNARLTRGSWSFAGFAGPKPVGTCTINTP